MKIHCHTNLDLHPCETWPDELPCRPMVGDYMTSSTGLELTVCSVAFKKVKCPPAFSDWNEGSETICNVELHLPPHRFDNVTTFEKWYKNRK